MSGLDITLRIRLTFDVEINSNVKSGMVFSNIYDFCEFLLIVIMEVFMKFLQRLVLVNIDFVNPLGYTNHLNVLTVKDVVFQVFT